MAQHLDLKNGALTGDPVRLADPVGASPLGLGGFSVSADGRLAYRSGGESLGQLKCMTGPARPWVWLAIPTRLQCAIPNCHWMANTWLSRACAKQYRRMAHGPRPGRHYAIDIRSGSRLWCRSGRRTGRVSPSRRRGKAPSNCTSRP